MRYLIRPLHRDPLIMRPEYLTISTGQWFHDRDPHRDFGLRHHESGLLGPVHVHDVWGDERMLMVECSDLAERQAT